MFTAIMKINYCKQTTLMVTVIEVLQLEQVLKKFSKKLYRKAAVLTRKSSTNSELIKFLNYILHFTLTAR